MGSTSGSARLASGLDVTIAMPFAVGKFEVTFAEWDECERSSRSNSLFVNGCKHRPDDRGWGRDRQPVMNVSWDDVQLYIAWLSQKTGRSYRLLSEAEWEYAAQAGSNREQKVTSGEGQANCEGCGGRWDGKQTAPVGSYTQNSFGLHDMLGNVAEWTADCWSTSYSSLKSDGSPWITWNCIRRVIRGGAWFTNAWYSRSADRGGDRVTKRSSDVGFRVARGL